MRAGTRALAAAAAFCLLAAGLTACLGDEDSEKKNVRTPRHPPVVMLVFDEFSTVSLLDRPDRVDAERYPSFAALARDSHWFPYATASLDETARAMRALFTGRTTWRYGRATLQEHPHNLFTILGRRYRMNASEEVSSMCPRRLCRRVREQNRHSILRKLAAGRPERLDRWLASLRASRRPTLYFTHVLLPHGPWEYLPSGRRYAEPPIRKSFSWGLEHYDRWLVNQRYQQHLLQVAYTDRLLGKVMDRLRATGLYDRSLIVVTADNGESFGRLGNGHEISSRNAGDIALTPLFVKLPHQDGGRVDRRHVRIIDVLPTIARLAHVPPRRRLEGRSIFGGGARKIPGNTVMIKRTGERLRLSEAELHRRAGDAVRLKLRLFGSGGGAPGLYGMGPHPETHGTPVDRWPTLRPGATRALVDAPSGSVPLKLGGRLSGPGSGRRVDVAVAVNGKIVATAPSVQPVRGGPQAFSALIPEDSLRPGRDRLEVFELVRGRTPRLRPLTP